MAALSIIKHFEIFKDLLRGLLPCVILTMMNAFPFQGPKETLDAGVVPAITLATHAGKEPILIKETLVAHGGLRPLPV